MDLSTRQGRREQGQRIQQAVERAELSIEELAGRIGCSRALIYQYLSGSTLAQPDRLQQIALICGVPLTFFYSESPVSGSPSIAPDSLAVSAVSAPPASTQAETVTSERENASASAPAPLSLNPQDVTARLSDGLRGLQELAEAQEGPPDYRALASTCERILSLAAQLGDRNAQARAQLDLGIALNKIGDFPRAVDALNRAVTLAAETGNTRQEMSARQSLGRALTMLGRTEQARAQFQRIVSGEDFNARWRGLLSLGSLHEQQGEYRQAMQRFDEAAALLEEGQANQLAEAQSIAVGLLYVNTNRRNVYMAEGDLGEARRLGEKCLADAEALGNADQNLATRLDLGWCDLYTGRWAQAQAGLTATMQLARYVGDVRQETLARSSLSALQAAYGDFDAAIANAKDALAVALSRGDRQAELYAQLALADAYTGPGGRATEARYHCSQALAITTSVSFARMKIECLLRVARLNAQVQDTVGLQEAASQAVDMARNLGARHLESQAQVWLAEAYLAGVRADFEPSNGGAENVRQENAGRRENLSAPYNEALRQARQIAGASLEAAQSIGFVETMWRARNVLARLDTLMGDSKQAESNLRAAIDTLETLRASLLAADIPDTLLENEDCLNVYERLTRLLIETGHAQDATAFLEQSGWPPLTARLEVFLTASQIPVEE